MARDMLLYGFNAADDMADFDAWLNENPDLHKFVPDYHRLQIEKWLFDKRATMGPRIMDVGVDNPRRWLGPDYFTFGEGGEDVRGDLVSFPFTENDLDTIICTEVLEHCADPFTACRNMHRALKPGGRLFVTSPFFWPWHGTPQYADYWRFTAQGWEALLKPFARVDIWACAWTPEGRVFYDFMRRFECMGMNALTVATTGYCCEAVK
jgi:SAM-dependent methyltransferase